MGGTMAMRRWVNLALASVIGVSSAMVITPGLLGGAAVQAAGPAIDNFSSGTYSGGSGWNGNWTELNDDATAPVTSTGTITINGGALRFQNLDGDSISRAVDLSAYSPGAQVSFTLVSEVGDEGLVVAFKSGPNAGDFTTVTTTPNSPAGTTLTFSLTPAMLRADGQLRITGADNTWDGTDQITIDNIRVAEKVVNPDLAPGCGIDVVLVLDESGSIGATFDQDVEAATQTFVSALN